MHLWFAWNATTVDAPPHVLRSPARGFQGEFCAESTSSAVGRGRLDHHKHRTFLSLYPVATPAANRRSLWFSSGRWCDVRGRVLPTSLQGPPALMSTSAWMLRSILGSLQHLLRKNPSSSHAFLSFFCLLDSLRYLKTSCAIWIGWCRMGST